MSDLANILLRIADTLDRIATNLETDQADKIAEEHKKRMRLYLAVEDDKRFPGLATKVKEPDLYFSRPMLDWLSDEANDAVAVMNYLASHKSVCKRISVADDRAMKAELRRIDESLLAQSGSEAGVILSGIFRKGGPESPPPESSKPIS